MPKLQCNCGEILRYGEIPNPIEWLLISDVDFDKFAGMVDSEQIYVSAKNLLRCPKCLRIWIFWNGFSESPQSFLLEGQG
jgi:hypothetical protein